MSANKYRLPLSNNGELLAIQNVPVGDGTLVLDGFRVVDTGFLPECAGCCAVAAVLRWLMKAEGFKDLQPSRLFLNYNANEGWGDASISSVFKGIDVHGVCAESLFDYEARFVGIKPPRYCYKNSKLPFDIEWGRIKQDVNVVKQALKTGVPIVVGMLVYSSFNRVCEDGIVPCPVAGETVIGTQPVVVIGWDDVRGMFKIMNVEGTWWGEYGFGWMEYKHLADPNIVVELWVCRRKA